MSREIEVSALTQGYIKSCGRTQVDNLLIGEKGPHLGRHWMIVDHQGSFVLSDKYPKMVWIEPFVSDSVLVLQGKGSSQVLDVPINDDSERVEVEMFEGRKYEAVDDGDQVAAWVSEYLGVDGLRLVHMPNDYERRDSKGLARLEFADSWSMTLGNDASLAELNREIIQSGGNGVPRERFGHDIWVAGYLPYEEDNWTKIDIAGLGIQVIKPVVRCARTLVRREAQNQEALLKKDSEPLATLNKTRKVVVEMADGKKKNNVIFGQKLAHQWEGKSRTISVGDRVNVLVFKA